MTTKDKYGRDMTSIKKRMDHKPYSTEPARDGLMYINPDMAKQLLATNDKNRYIRPSKVDQYARDMMNGNWGTNGHEISLSPSGKLIDGQHRMLAVIEADMTIPFRVAYDVPEDTLFDLGVPRSHADTAKIGNLLNNPDLATTRAMALVNSFFCCLYGSALAKRITTYDRAGFINEHEDNILFVLKIVGSGKDLMNRGPIMATLVAALECGLDKEVIADFTRAVNTGVVYDDEHSAAVILRTVILESKYGGGSKRAEYIASVTCQSIRDFNAAKPRKNKYTPGALPYFEKLREVM